ncbi:MAG: ATP-dependent metallopeptidase FtsH/Yme1/Tma family protein, partial [Clostridia bacterium]|nr:ATP-dependent metallopeptidase FtsH/Yme1/Tma family protein [Clostridia bacterium]
MNNNRRRLSTPLVYLILMGIIIMLVSGFDLSGKEAEGIAYSEFISAVREGKIAAAEITELELVGIYTDGETDPALFPEEADFYTNIPSLDIFTADMKTVTAELTGIPFEKVTQADYSFNLVINPDPQPGFFAAILPYLLMFGGLALFYIFMMRAQGGGNNVMNFGKSRA